MGKIKKYAGFGLLIVFAAAIIGAPLMGASGDYLEIFNAKYNTAGTKLDACETCHMSPTGGSTLNSYGLDIKNQLRARVTVDQALTKTQSKDSDGDGYTNIDEINAGTLPGDPSDH